MKLIEPKKKTVRKNSLEKILEQVRQLIPFGKTDENTEEAIVARFLRGLDNNFIMLRHLQLESGGKVFPAILIGPVGIAVLNISCEKGFFKAKDDAWFRMDTTTHKFNQIRPNLIKQTQEYAKNLGTILDVHGKSHPEITPILIFANPGVHVETTNPAIRIVLMDGVDNMIATFLRSEEVLQPNEITFLSDAIEVMANPDKAIPLGEGEDFFGRDLFVPEKKTPPKMPSLSVPTDMPEVEKRFNFSRKQWAIVVVLLVLTIIILLAAILFALSGI
jgi:Nuclease-related domain